MGEKQKKNAIAPGGAHGRNREAPPRMRDDAGRTRWRLDLKRILASCRGLGFNSAVWTTTGSGGERVGPTSLGA